MRKDRRVGNGIGIVWKNEYFEELSASSRIHVIWLNKEEASFDGALPIRGLSRAEKSESLFRDADVYRPTFALLDEWRFSERGEIEGLTNEAVKVKSDFKRN